MIHIIFLFFLSAQANDGVLLAKVSGQVGEEVISSRTVKLYYVFEQAFKKQPLDPMMNEDHPKFPSVISEALLEEMIFLETQAIKVEDVSAAEKLSFEQDLNALIRSGQNMNYWKNLEVTVKEKDFFIDKKLKSKKLLQFRTQASAVTVTDREALNYYQKNKNKFGSTPFEKLKGNIKNFLEQENTEARLKDWLTILQKKYNVKHLGLKGANAN